MILVDTSAWVEFLRDTGSPACDRVDALLAGDVATCDVVRMEVLAGGRDDHHLHQLRRLLARAAALDTQPVDYEHAARIYRAARRSGETIRRLTDCLIAAVAIRHGVPLLHADRDFDAVARSSPLRIDPLT